MSVPEYRRLLTGLDTVQAAYYLRPTRGIFSFEELLDQKERLRADKSRESKVIQIGAWAFTLQPYGSGSGYPLVLENPQLTLECGEYNSPTFFVTFRSQALWERGALSLTQVVA